MVKLLIGCLFLSAMAAVDANTNKNITLSRNITNAPTPKPSNSNTNAPTPKPSHSTTNAPTPKPSHSTTNAPTPKPSHSTTNAPTPKPSHSTTNAPTPKPSHSTTNAPTPKPSHSTINVPTPKPSHSTTNAPTPKPSHSTTNAPTPKPSHSTTNVPTPKPSHSITNAPTPKPSHSTTNAPASKPSNNITNATFSKPLNNITNASTPKSSKNITNMSFTNKPVGTTQSAVTYKDTSLSPSTAAPSSYIENVGTSPVELPLSVTIESRSFETINLTDKSSAQYKNLTETITTDLTKLYKHTPGFRRVEVYDLSKGSIKASYYVVLDSAAELDEAITTIKTKVIPLLLNASIASGTVNKTKTNQAMDVIINKDSKKNICSFLKQPVCKYGYFCKSDSLALEVSCVSNCSLHKSLCNHHGDCYMDSPADELKCRCHQDDNYVYSGEYCDIKTEKLGLEKNYIIAIAVGSGGIVILIFLIIITVLLWKRKKENTKDKYIEDTHRSVSMEDLRLQKFENGSYNGYQGYRSRTPTSGNVYESGLPESREQDRRSRTPTARNSYDSESRLVDGKEHKILKDERGSETLIYQPSNLSRPYSTASSHIDAELNSSRPTVYDYIDTDKRYEILRPKVYGERRYDYEY